MDQNLSGYKIFYEVAKSGNISKAAKRLYISQPAISKSIVKLEEGLDTKLFHRNSRGVSLTSEGEMLFRHVSSAFESLDQAENELKKVRDLNIGHLNIGTSTTLCKYVLFPYLEKYISKYPNVRISIQTEDSLTTLEKLDRDGLDIGLIAIPESHRQELKTEHVMKIHDIFVSSPHYLKSLARLNPGLDINDSVSVLKEASIALLNPQNMTRQHIDRYLESQEISPKHMMQAGSMELLIDYAKLGLGVSSVIREFIKDELYDGSLIELSLPKNIPERTIGFAYNRNSLTKQIQSFLDL